MSCQNESTSYSSVLSELAALVPFPDYITPTRVGLVPMYINQAVCTLACIYDPTRAVVPLYLCIPFMLPNDMGTRHTSSYYLLQGLNIFVVFCNMSYTHTYKDGVVLSSSAACRFKYFCTKTIHISSSSSSRVPQLNDTISPFSVP